MTVRCPVCHRDADTLTRRDGTLRAHNRPVGIPGGVASTACAGSGRPPEAAETPAWIAAAFTDTR